ncbi:unnamed protein product [Ectocarpus sp. CCAP 1310/34]|nr:unnamed protein product [Ectocarpus sp. CCAP 1310/34]
MALLLAAHCISIKLCRPFLLVRRVAVAHKPPLVPNGFMTVVHLFRWHECLWIWLLHIHRSRWFRLSLRFQPLPMQPSQKFRLPPLQLLLSFRLPWLLPLVVMHLVL